MSEQASGASAKQLGLTAVTDLLGPDVTRAHQMSTPRHVSVDFACDPAAWCDAWSMSGSTHHSSIGAGHRTEELRILAEPARHRISLGAAGLMGGCHRDM